MCVLIVCPPQCTPARERLVRGARNNPDGTGWAVQDGAGGVIVHRGLRTDVDGFLKARAAHLDQWAVWHARIATHGAVEVAGVHPHPVADVPGAWLAHNGVFEHAVPLKGDARSDTRCAADDWGFLWSPSALGDRVHLAAVERWAGSSRAAVIAPTGPVAIVNERLGTWGDDGCWRSNDSTEPVRYWPAPKGSWTAEDGKGYCVDAPFPWLGRWCPSCGRQLPDLEGADWSPVCDACGLCFDCGRDAWLAEEDGGCSCGWLWDGYGWDEDADGWAVSVPSSTPSDRRGCPVDDDADCWAVDWPPVRSRDDWRSHWCNWCGEDDADCICPRGAR